MARRVTVATARAAGLAARLTRRKGAGLLGAGAVAYGLGEIYAPLLWIAAGLFLLVVDWGTP